MLLEIVETDWGATRVLLNMDELPEHYGSTLFPWRVTEIFRGVLKSNLGGKWKFWVWVSIETVSGLIRPNAMVSQISSAYIGR